MRQHFYSYFRVKTLLLSCTLSTLLLVGCNDSGSDAPEVSIPVTPNLENAEPATPEVTETSTNTPGVQTPIVDNTTPGVTNPAANNPATASNPTTDVTTTQLTQNDVVADPQQPPAMTAAELAESLKLNQVPDGTPEELLKYIDGLTKTPFPDNASEDELRSFAVQIYTNVLTATDKILNQQSTSEFHRDAVQYKFMAYEVLKDLQPEKADAILAERMTIAQQLTQVKDPLVSIFARLFLFETMLIDFAGGKQDLFKPVYEDAKAIIGAPMADQNNFGAVMNAANVFAQMGHSVEAVELLGLLKAKFSTHENPQVSTRAKALDNDILQYKIVGNMMSTMNGEDQSEALLANLQALIDLLGKETLDPLQMIQTIERQMEAFNKIELAKKLSQLMLDNYKDHPNIQVAESVKMSAEYASRRLALVGKPFALTGNNLDGSPFNWDEYRGKYVLIDFWATWCEPCLQEIPNIEQNYIQYRQAGFEVIGVNLNDTRQELDQFFSQRALPWPTIVTEDPNAVGMETPVAVKSGVDGIPFLVLVDPKGIVVEINPRGKRLGEVLQSILSVEAQGTPTVEGLQNNLNIPATTPNTPAAGG